MITVQQRNTLISLIYSFLQIPVIPDDEDADIPPYPYVVYSNTTPHSVTGHDSVLYGAAMETTQERSFSNQNEPSFSFTAYSDSRDEAQTIIENMIEWMERTGSDDLQDNGFAVVEITNAQNRSIRLVDHYVRRFGFDVRLRHESKTTDQIDTIAQAEITNTGG